MPWEDLLSLVEEVKAEQSVDQNRPPVDCPKDGEPLRSSAGGQIYCPFCGWKHPQDNW